MPNTDEGANNLVLRYLRATERKVDQLIDNIREQITCLRWRPA
jgi:hypothetical protein